MGERSMWMYNIFLQYGVKDTLDCSLCPGKWYFIQRDYYLLFLWYKLLGRNTMTLCGVNGHLRRSFFSLSD